MPPSATSRYSAPLSSRCQPTREATMRLMVPLPELEGPSMVTMGTEVSRAHWPERLSSFPGFQETIVLFGSAQRDAQVFGQTDSCRPAAR